MKPEVSYIWSDGDSGLETLMTHDGPIEVSAHIGNCSTSEQIDLPIDLKPWLGYSPKAVIQIVINSTPTKTAFPQYL